VTPSLEVCPCHIGFEVPYTKLPNSVYLTLPIAVIVVVNRTERPSRICAHITRKVPSGREVIPK